MFGFFKSKWKKRMEERLEKLEKEVEALNLYKNKSFEKLKELEGRVSSLELSDKAVNIGFSQNLNESRNLINECMTNVEEVVSIVSDLSSVVSSLKDNCMMKDSAVSILKDFINDEEAVEKEEIKEKKKETKKGSIGEALKETPKRGRPKKDK